MKQIENQFDTMLEISDIYPIIGRTSHHLRISYTMKRILCYGDSNTWGYDPLTTDRFDANTRWTRVLGKSLGGAYEVIEEGLNGRTTVWDDPIEGFKSGKDYLIPCLEFTSPARSGDHPAGHERSQGAFQRSGL